jgi:hypothetical protein
MAGREAAVASAILIVVPAKAEMTVGYMESAAQSF